MELHKNACPNCGGDCTGPVMSGWFTCRNCKRRHPRSMLIVPAVYKFQCRHCYIVSGHVSYNKNDAPTCCFGDMMDAIRIG